MGRRALTVAEQRATRNLKQLWQRENTDRVMRGDDRLTQEEAGLAMGMGQSAVSQFLRGEVPLGLESVLKFSRLLNVDPRQIRKDLAELNWALERVEQLACIQTALQYLHEEFPYFLAGVAQYDRADVIGAGQLADDLPAVGAAHFYPLDRFFREP